MRILIHKEKKEGKEYYYLVDSQSSKITRFETEELIEWKYGNSDVFVENLKFKNSRNFEAEEKVCGKQVFILEKLVQKTGKEMRTVGFKMFVPETIANESLGETKEYCISRCFLLSEAVELIEKFGCLNGKVVCMVGSNKPNSIQKVISAKVGSAPADKHVGLYLRLYHQRKRYAKEHGFPVEKIVRVDSSRLELRSIPDGLFDYLETPEHVHNINLKHWRIVVDSDTIHKVIDEKPEIDSLKLWDGVETILYNDCTSTEFPEEDLGAFSKMSIKKLNLGNRITNIGKYAFAFNSIEAVEFPKSVRVIGEHSFKGNPIRHIGFSEHIDMLNKNKRITPIEIHKGAFEGINLNYENLSLPPIGLLGESAFKGSGLLTVSFHPKSTLRAIAPGAFEDTKIKKAFIPDSVEVIASRAYAGAPVDSVLLRNTSRLKYIFDDAFDDINSINFVIGGKRYSYNNPELHQRIKFISHNSPELKTDNLLKIDYETGVVPGEPAVNKRPAARKQAGRKSVTRKTSGKGMTNKKGNGRKVNNKSNKPSKRKK